MLSAVLRTSTSSRRRASSAACASASRTMRSTSSLARPLPAVIVIFCSRPVPLSLADTCTTPLASMSKVTSICGTPRGAGGMPSRWNLPSVLLYWAISRSPCSTWISTLGWLSDGGREDLALAGRDGGVALDQLGEHAAERLDAQARAGVTSSSSTSLTSPESTPAWIAAPMRHHLVGVDAPIAAPCRTAP